MASFCSGVCCDVQVLFVRKRMSRSWCMSIDDIRGVISSFMIMQVNKPAGVFTRWFGNSLTYR